VPTVLTARYRLRSGPVFGNLLAAFAVDMLRLRSEPAAELRGDLLPEVEPNPQSVWSLFAVSEHRYGVSTDHGEFDERSREALLEVMSDPKALPPHRRLLLFGELEGDPGEARQWDEAMAFLTRLPRNVTIVVSNAPPGWPGAPEIEAPAGGEPGHEEVFTFVEAALSGDQAADFDHRLDRRPRPDRRRAGDRVALLPGRPAAQRAGRRVRPSTPT
jgi:hypothetical protein